MTALLFMFLQMTLLEDAIEISFYYYSVMGKLRKNPAATCFSFLSRRTQKGVNRQEQQRYCPLLHVVRNIVVRHFTNG